MSTATKVTPGRWEVHQERVGVFLVMAPDGMAVAEGVGSIFDAQLLAAAPDLYSALAVLVTSIDRLGQVETPNMRAARAALARAEVRP